MSEDNMKDEIIVWYCNGYFPFEPKTRYKREWGDVGDRLGSHIEAQHLQLQLKIDYYKQKRSNVSKKHRRAKKEHKKFLRLINQHTKEKAELFENNLEYFI